MKKIYRCFVNGIAIVMLTSCMVFFTGCSCIRCGGKNTTPKEYTIQYTDESGAHTITVTDGMPYSLDVIPEKTGYDFLGLYDAEIGGTRYVSANGSSLAPFTDKKNMVLFPQYKAKDYTLILDYQGGAVTGSRQFTVAYGSSLPELPKNLMVDHKEFVGWYTEADCGGTKIADKVGLIPVVSVLNEQNFDLSSSSVTLYAGFEWEKLKVTFQFEKGIAEDVLVAYDTPINQVVPKTRVDGNAVLTWSKTENGEVWNGKVTYDNLVLYAVEYAPVIEFDCSGGDEVTPLVARAGSTITLPTPTKDLAKFSYWEDMSGNRYTSTIMPTKSTSLKAVWQAKLVFDENGGSDVDDISEKEGTSITLPIPEREGFIFAGWYTADKEQYTSTTMPTAGIKLKAGWYKEQKTTITQCSGDSYLNYNNTSATLKNGLTLDFSAYLPEYFSGNVKIDAYLKILSNHASLSSKQNMTLYFYSTGTISDNYLLYYKTFEITSSSYANYAFSFTANITGNKIYCAEKVSSYTYISDYYYELTYPDTTNLYL